MKIMKARTLVLIAVIASIAVTGFGNTTSDLSQDSTAAISPPGDDMVVTVVNSNPEMVSEFTLQDYTLRDQDVLLNEESSEISFPVLQKNTGEPVQLSKVNESENYFRRARDGLSCNNSTNSIA